MLKSEVKLKTSICKIKHIHSQKLNYFAFHNPSLNLTSEYWFQSYHTEKHYKISQFYRRKHSVGVWLEVRRWFFYRRHHRRITSIDFPFVGDSPFRRYIGRKNKKNHLPMVLQTTFTRQKKRFPLEIYRRFLVRRDIMIDRRKITVGKSVGECMKYRQNMSVCKFVGNCGSYC